MNIIDITDEELKNIDLTSFIKGEALYGNSDSSLENTFVKGKEFYLKMVQDRTQFTGGRVLDLLSGHGRWLPFLSAFNDEVIAIERIEKSQLLAKRLCDYFDIKNVKFLTGDVSLIENIKKETIDYVWLWSGLQYISRDYALNQVRRVLRPGGRIFVGAYNGPGLMIEHVKNGIKNGMLFEGASKWALTGLAKGPLDNGEPNFIDLDSCSEICEMYGFRLIVAASSGNIDITDSRNVERIEPASHVDGYVRTVEFIAEKK